MKLSKEEKAGFGIIGFCLAGALICVNIVSQNSHPRDFSITFQPSASAPENIRKLMRLAGLDTKLTDQIDLLKGDLR